MSGYEDSAPIAVAGISITGLVQTAAGRLHQSGHAAAIAADYPSTLADSVEKITGLGHEET